MRTVSSSLRPYTVEVSLLDRMKEGIVDTNFPGGVRIVGNMPYFLNNLRAIWKSGSHIIVKCIIRRNAKVGLH